MGRGDIPGEEGGYTRWGVGIYPPGWYTHPYKSVEFLYTV